jgi:hypothetical protein
MSSIIKVDNIQNQSGANIIKEDSNTITLGASGDTIALASGASQSGFGRTGTVDWQTSSIKTATFTAANGEGYFANTSGGTFTMNLPAGTAGNIVSVVDYTNTFQTNKLTISPNGSQKIGGIAQDTELTTEGQSVTFVYVDDTEGWKNTMDSTSNVTGTLPYVAATGGTITTCGDFKIHKFTGPGTFTVTAAGSPSGSNTVDYLVVAGGSGGGQSGGGGGAGGYRSNFPQPATSGLPVSAQAYPITVGAGGNGGTGFPAPTNTGGNGCAGSNAIFSSITSAGGGAGGGYGNTAGNGGSGGGGGMNSPPGGGSGNTPPVSPPQGNDGGDGQGSSGDASGGGGGASAVGANGVQSSQSGVGGAGSPNSITGSAVTYAGGGGGGGRNQGPGLISAPGAGGAGGGGAGGPNNPAGNGVNGTVNTGGGGGGSGFTGQGGGPGVSGGSGGSGIVVIRYKFQ